MIEIPTFFTAIYLLCVRGHWWLFKINNCHDCNVLVDKTKNTLKYTFLPYKYPKVVFKSVSVKFEDSKFNIQGLLKIRDVSKPVKLVVTVLETYSPDSEKLLFSIQASFQRRQFGADGYYPLVRDTIIIEDILMLNKSINF